ncbi:hypothetical protein CLOM_g8053 [Closterium sp. NIES-68]|nr:hypothetical protein CLOM_g8053 [Closterium sp. NIES-68]GJP65046.1 hypothetical protein CLOP_g21963 [Closterium sp. NIES-67]
MALDNGPASSGDAREVVAELRQRLLDRALPIEQRIRALFSLRNLKGDTPQQALIEAMEDKSVLLAHEAAFALGQMGDVFSVPALTRVLEDPSYHPIVRHEAAEALGAIGEASSLPLLQTYLADPAPEVRETCELAVRRLQDTLAAAEEGREGERKGEGETEGAKGEGGGEGEGKRFMSVDPAGSAPKNASTEELRKLLLQEDANMYDRYGALFALRDKAAATSNAGDAAAGAGGGGDSGGAGAAGAGGGGDSGGAGAAGAGGGGDSGGAGGSSGASFASEAVTAIVEALETCTSALLRHEIAYVLGQLQNKTAAQALVRALQDTSCHAMVRHEAAVALGSVADPLTLQLLREFQKDPDPIVAESCDVALDLMRFELQPDAFQYADLLE